MTLFAVIVLYIAYYAMEV